MKIRFLWMLNERLNFDIMTLCVFKYYCYFLAVYSQQALQT